MTDEQSHPIHSILESGWTRRCRGWRRPGRKPRYHAEGFIQTSNHARPHQALHMKYPAELYSPSPQPYTGLSEVDWLVSFMHYDLGFFHEEADRVECAENSFDAKVLPMSARNRPG